MRRIIGDGNDNSKSTPLTFAALQLDGATEQAREFPRDGKAKTGTAIFSADGAVRLVERFEDISLLFVRDTDASIRYGECDPAIPDLSDRERYLSVLRKFERVGQKILKYLLQP